MICCLSEWFYSTLQMLTNIENRLEDLFQQIELLPADKVEAAEKVISFHYCICVILVFK